MPMRLLVRAANSPTFPVSGSWRKGDIVRAAPAGHVWGRLEGPPDFVRADLAFATTVDDTWIQDQIDDQGGRRTVGMEAAEVDSILAAGGTRSYATTQSFVHVLEVKKS